MLFALIVLIVIGIVAFFHYTQGMWSATLSALMAAIAALVAMSFHESVANLLVAAKMVNQAHGITLVLLFAITYIVLRVAFDKMVPGNIRLPLLLDKVGGAAMGIVAGIFAAGILAVAAQALPFGPSIGGYSRYELEDERDVTVGGARSGQQMIDTSVVDELSGNAFDPEKHQGLPILPVDAMVVSFTEKQSANGALAGARPLQSVHPNYLDELFNNRIGIEPGSQRTAINAEGTEQMKVEGVFRLQEIPRQVDAEIDSTRSALVEWPKVAPTGKTFFIVRAIFDIDAADDKDKLFRFSPASVRLTTKNTESSGWHNYTPIGTLENGMLYANKPDDYLFVDFAVGAGADLVFLVTADDVLDDPNATPPKVANGVFIEVKRMARQDLSGKPVPTGVPPSPTVQLLRKPQITDAAKKAGATPAPQAPAGTDPAAPGAAATPGAGT